MVASTNTSKTLQVNGMSGDGCVQHLTNALKAVPGLTVDSVKVGSATVSGDQTALDSAGKVASEIVFKGQDAKKSTAPAAAQTEVKAGNHPAGTQNSSKNATEAAGANTSPSNSPVTPNANPTTPASAPVAATT